MVGDNKTSTGTSLTEASCSRLKQDVNLHTLEKCNFILQASCELNITNNTLRLKRKDSTL